MYPQGIKKPLLKSVSFNKNQAPGHLRVLNFKY